jgi:hypothetical protein
MLKYFFITWVVAFLALCLPLLLLIKNKKENDKVSIGKFVISMTGILNIIFLIILPYIIDTDFNFPFYYSTYVICLIIIVLLFVLLTLISSLRPTTSSGIPFDFSGGPAFIILLIIFPFIPGAILTKLVDYL